VGDGDGDVESLVAVRRQGMVFSNLAVKRGAVVGHDDVITAGLSALGDGDGLLDHIRSGVELLDSTNVMTAGTLQANFSLVRNIRVRWPVDVVQRESFPSAHNIALGRLQDDYLTHGTRDTGGSNESRSRQGSHEQGCKGEQHLQRKWGLKDCGS